jgi:hypothetical protein
MLLGIPASHDLILLCASPKVLYKMEIGDAMYQVHRLHKLVKTDKKHISTI